MLYGITENWINILFPGYDADKLYWTVGSMSRFWCDKRISLCKHTHFILVIQKYYHSFVKNIVKICIVKICCLIINENVHYLM